MHRIFTKEFHGFPILNQSKPKPQNLVTRNITNKMHQNAPRKWTSQCTHFDAFCDFYLCIAGRARRLEGPEDVVSIPTSSIHHGFFLGVFNMSGFSGIQTARWIISPTFIAAPLIRRLDMGWLYLLRSLPLCLQGRAKKLQIALAIFGKDPQKLVSAEFWWLNPAAQREYTSLLSIWVTH